MAVGFELYVVDRSNKSSSIPRRAKLNDFLSPAMSRSIMQSHMMEALVLVIPSCKLDQTVTAWFKTQIVSSPPVFAEPRRYDLDD